MSDPYMQALIRGTIGAFIVAGATFFSVFASTEESRILVAATGGSFFSFLAMRAGVEGYIDHRRAR